MGNWFFMFTKCKNFVLCVLRFFSFEKTNLSFSFCYVDVIRNKMIYSWRIDDWFWIQIFFATCICLFKLSQHWPFGNLCSIQLILQLNLTWLSLVHHYHTMHYWLVSGTNPRHVCHLMVQSVLQITIEWTSLRPSYLFHAFLSSTHYRIGQIWKQKEIMGKVLLDKFEWLCRYRPENCGQLTGGMR